MILYLIFQVFIYKNIEYQNNSKDIRRHYTLHVLKKKKSINRIEGVNSLLVLFGCHWVLSFFLYIYTIYPLG